MRRREFITLFGGAAAWPLAARAQQPGVPVVGFLGAGARGPLREQIAAFQEGLKESGYVEGQNVAVEYRFAEGQFDRFPALASDLVPSLNRPGGNLTGVYQFANGLEAKRLGLLHEMVPKATTIAVLVNPNYSGSEN